MSELIKQGLISSANTKAQEVQFTMIELKKKLLSKNENESKLAIVLINVISDFAFNDAVPKAESFLREEKKIVLS